MGFYKVSAALANEGCLARSSALSVSSNHASGTESTSTEGRRSASQRIRLARRHGLGVGLVRPWSRREGHGRTKTTGDEGHGVPWGLKDIIDQV